MGTYVVIEAGDSAYTEFMMKDGEYWQTEDAILVGIVEGKSKEDAIKEATRLEYCREREFDMLIAYRLAPA